jgi:hypothetical protein
MDGRGFDDLYNEHYRKDTDIYKMKRNANFEILNPQTIDMYNSFEIRVCLEF